jgi:hypothetical protein
MGSSFHRCRPRYRKLQRAAIFGTICLALFGISFAQIAKRAHSSKGPRALGLVELAANGKAHLIAVTIMIDGKFYDAGAYKADPVPMALQGETVYEALKAGVPQGLFSVSGAMHDENNGSWIADGKWRSTAQIETDKAKAKAAADKKAQKGPRPEQQIGAPPRLRRAPEPTPETTPPVSSTAPPAPEKSSPPPQAGSPPVSSSSTAPSTPASTSAPEDPNRPVLRHVAPSETAHEQTKVGGGSTVIHEQTKSGIKVDPLSGPIEFIPAISDADGPEARPYTYEMKPDAEQSFLKKMLAMAGQEVRTRTKAAAGAGEPKSKASDRNVRPTREPQFQDVQLHVYDLSNSNEPVLVLTANATFPSEPNLVYMIALVARQDIYGDLHKVFAQTTDNQHLDVLAKYELIDAVDADGDGSGELLFRITSEAGSAFGVYRVIGDRLWPLFEGKPR